MNRLVFLTTLLVLVMSGCKSKTPEHAPAALQRFEFQKPEMGLPFRIVLYATDEKKANEAVAAAFKRIEEINDRMSDYDPDSELSQLSKTAGQGRAVKVSDELWFVLEQAQRLSQDTDGAFDITVGPVVQLWRKARREKKLPDPTELAKARTSLGFKHLKLDPKTHTAELLVAGMKLDLGAIAKGYADDEALKALRGLGVTRALVTGGGDMAAGDAPPGKSGWQIELAPLDVPNAPPTNYVIIANCGLATSGDLFQHVEIDGKRYSHIVDPHTGIGLTDHSLVIVIAANAITADSLSTVVSVLGPERGLSVVRAHHGVSRIARKVNERVEVFESNQFRKFLSKQN